MLIEPVSLSDFFLSFFSAAAIVLTALLYAALYACAKLHNHRGLFLGAWLSYGLLLICVALFSKVNHLNGIWLLLSLSMVIGYAFMPRMIWQLCVATHSDSDHSLPSGGAHD
ncbi:MULTISPECIES: hypothetical protein [Methylomonas]|uniref:hypothetical protein n=1 Tax=Methylomonas TaxID=416 RepID=UPI0012318536|nr:hypothetical protein [Methylomonas rhizoryzae]